MKIASRILRSFCPEHLYEEIEGDLIQKFERDVKAVGERKAKRKLVWNVIRFFRPGILLRNVVSIEHNNIYMLKNYLKISYRQMMKSKIFTLINVTGLAVGIVAFLLIVQYVSFQNSYDQFHENKNEIYRITYSQYENHELKNTSAKNYLGVRSLLKDNFPEIENFTAFEPVPANTGFLFGYNNKMYLEAGGFLMADSSFFQVFPSLLVQGNGTTVLRDPFSIILSESMAKKIFGDQDPVGKELLNYGDFIPGKNFIVSGIFRDIPENTHFHANFISSAEYSEDTPDEYWTAPKAYNYVTIPNGINVKSIEERLNTLLKNIQTDHNDVKGVRISFQPIVDIHLHSNLQDEIETNGSNTLNNILMLIGIIILVIAWINYINIETARFKARSQEIGIRCVIGSRKIDLAFQFLIQYSCIAILALVLAAILFLFINPYLVLITGLPIQALKIYEPKTWFLAMGIFVGGSLLIGIYPTLFLLRINPAKAIKGKIIENDKGRLLRKPLVIFQFTSSVVLIAFLMVVVQQLDFMRVTNKKIDLEKVVSIVNPTAYADQEMAEKNKDLLSLEHKLLANPSIKMVSTSSAIPGAEIGFTLVNNLKRNKGDAYNSARYKLLFVDYNFISLYGLNLKAGRNYNIENGEAENKGRIILNESAIYALGFSSAKEALNQSVYLEIWDWLDPNYKIVGVVEDYNHQAIKEPVVPTIFFLNQRNFQAVYYSIKLNAGSNAKDALAHIEKSWKEIFPERPFHYFFLDDYYDQQFKSEIHFGRIFSLFSGVAVFLACIGILGISLFEATSRLREISIRKVLGASLISLLALLSSDNIKVIVVSTLISLPLIYVSANRWLSIYPIKINISYLFFVLPLLSLIIIVLTMSLFQTLKAVNSNPVDHLKNE